MKIKNDKILIQITCLVVSVILWMFIMVETNPPFEQYYNSIPVTIKNLSALENSNLVLMNSDKDHFMVNVKVKGTSDQFTNIANSDFSAYIDLLGFSEGITNAKIEVSGPSGLEITNFYPSQIACNIESIISKVMDVDVQYEGSQADDYYRLFPISKPSSVKITGPRSVVNSATMAVATVNIEGAADNVTKTVPVRVYDGTDTEIFMSAPIDNVEVTVPIYPTKYVKLVPNITGTPEEGYQLTDVTVKPDKIKIAARKDILDTINELEVSELDITGEFNNILSSREILDTESLIILDLNTNPVVSAVIEKTVEKDFVFEASEIQFNNLAEGINVDIPDSEHEITVNVVGPVSVVNQLKKNDLTLAADLSTVVPGTNNVNLECTTGKTVNTISVSQGQISIEVTESPASTTAEE
ncbi:MULTISPECIES: CdaR family protein [unclassified Sedimentibacter]|uniref:CdaR family protein n=1 Tax=unclassified Sedimentibacter TaxID=2649220 RepID=UPI0027E1F681|nr:CdaR family protein [Sedimentibacter sp. MB35-C1]WMJ76398.1 CdaR family protein [Sedimentibacter sp. MB35-C1]